MTKVKVCGIRRLEEARWAVEAGADAIGFVFADSKRKIDIETAAQISSHLPENVLKIGVFVNSSEDELSEAAKKVKLDFVQLHGDETYSFCSKLYVPYIKAISVKEKDDLKRIEEFNESMILLDSGKGPYRGGNGTTFDWDYLESIDLAGKKLILAGGLNEDNVKEAIEKVHPYMVDVSSGVETEGKKDKRKIESFVKKVKGIE